MLPLNAFTMVDISHKCHSLIIGRNGFKVRRIAEESSTHIHFPDENKSDSLPKTNTAVIVGELTSIRHALGLMRGLVEIEIILKFKINSSDVTISRLISYIRDNFQVSISVIESFRDEVYFNIKVSTRNVQNLKKAYIYLKKQFSGQTNQKVILIFDMESHYFPLYGQPSARFEALKIEMLARTNVFIDKLNTKSQKDQKIDFFTLKGSLDDVLDARQIMIDNLFLFFNFTIDQKTEDILSCIELSTLSKQYDVTLIFKENKDSKTSPHTFTVMSREGNFDNVIFICNFINKIIKNYRKVNVPYSPKLQIQDNNSRIGKNWTTKSSRNPSTSSSSTINDDTTQPGTPYESGRMKSESILSRYFNGKLMIV